MKIKEKGLVAMKPRSITYDYVAIRPEPAKEQVYEKVARGDFYGKQIQDREKLNIVARRTIEHLFDNS
jgi:hypothetical protein